MENIFKDLSDLLKKENEQLKINHLIYKLQEENDNYICLLNGEIIINFKETEFEEIIKNLKFKETVFDGIFKYYKYFLDDDEYLFFKTDVKKYSIQNKYILKLKNEHCLNFISRIRTNDIGEDWNSDTEFSNKSLNYSSFEREYEIISFV